MPAKCEGAGAKSRAVREAVIEAAVIAVIAEILYSSLGYSSYFTMGTVLWGISYTIPGIALTVFPYVKKDLFAQAPGWLGKKVAGIPLVSLMGLITTVGFGYIGFIA